MKWPALILAGFALTASAEKDTDYPHRDWGQVATLDMSVTEATTCIARFLARKGDAIVLPVEGGNDIDFAVRPMWGPKMEPWESFKVRDEAGVTTLRLFYRHPVRKKGAGKDIDRLVKACLKIRSLTPSS